MHVVDCDYVHEKNPGGLKQERINECTMEEEKCVTAFSLLCEQNLLCYKNKKNIKYRDSKTAEIRKPRQGSWH